MFCEIRILFERPDDQHEKSGRAESALQSMIFDECRLEVMQVVPIGKSFDGPDRRAISLMHEHEACSYRSAIHDYSTCPAGIDPTGVRVVALAAHR